MSDGADGQPVSDWSVRRVARGDVLRVRYATSMPSDLPRVTVYLPPETFDALDAAARAVGQSRSHFVAELVGAAVPVFGVLVDAANALKNAGEMQRAALRKTAEDLEPDVRDAQDALMRMLASVSDVASAKPPTSNTGVRKWS